MIIMDLIWLIAIFILSGILTSLFKSIFTRLGGNLYTPIRGGTPRAVGIAPFIVLLLFFPPPGNYLIALIGIFAFLDDIIGRKKIKGMPFEFGQLSRGIGMLLVMVIGYAYFGPASILIALMIQPMNIADMQPGTSASTVIIMGLLMAILLYLTTGNPYSPALILLAVCLGYAPLDYQGKIMMGEVGNHSFGVGLGVTYTLLAGNIANFHNWGSGGVFIVVLILLIFTALLIALLRQKNLKNFLETNLQIPNPGYGDLVMDVLTGGGLGDLLRRIILRKRTITIKNRFLIVLGMRRLFYNPHAV
ncbi:cell wall biosynthesis protein [Methanobacterium formicicum]|uniref:Cell wall biosynthesis protein n=1 Tax=Methanobacterium formicicum (strain DSM 3637 / PP1) TaxID=1204725 RepID=K2R133_METFP|nr:cell wall biosynthesis protein [Methanobacterium formicicum]EKF86243.1 cell wall biosynthesis protein [Methanobacterium formicicum DSM 3637]